MRVAGEDVKPDPKEFDLLVFTGLQQGIAWAREICRGVELRLFGEERCTVDTIQDAACAAIWANAREYIAATVGHQPYKFIGCSGRQQEVAVDAAATALPSMLQQGHPRAADVVPLLHLSAILLVLFGFCAPAQTY